MAVAVALDREPAEGAEPAQDQDNQAIVALCGGRKLLILRCVDWMLIQQQEAECRAGRVSPR
jgi:hypothetical protein